MSDFAILRVAKIHTLSGLSGAASHNDRTASSGTKHADNRAPLMGGGSQLVAGQEDAVAAWHTRTQAVGLCRPRKDAVRALEVLMSASPAWFSEASQDERQKWKDKSLAWATDLFGKDNILSGHLHDDEGNPHLHLLVVPLAQKSRKKAGRPRKGREAQLRKEITSWGLCAADLIGSAEKLVELQTQYASQLCDLGIRRGRARRVTGADHVSATAYRAQAADELIAAKSSREEAMGELTMAKDVGESASNKASKTLKNAQKAAQSVAAAFTIGLDAVDQEELIYQPETEGKHAGLIRKIVEDPVLPTGQPMQRWKRTIQPLFTALLAYARRSSMLRHRSAELDARTIKLSHREREVEADAATVSRMLKRAGQPIIQIENIRQRNRQKSR